MPTQNEREGRDRKRSGGLAGTAITEEQSVSQDALHREPAELHRTWRPAARRSSRSASQHERRELSCHALREPDDGVLAHMTGEAARLIPYALIAALSPLGFAATIAVIRTGRLRAFGFGVGVVLGQLVACAVLVVLGGASIPSREASHTTFEGLLELALGIALLCLAVAVYRRPSRWAQNPAASGRSKKLLDRLGHVRAITALFAGLMLGIGGPKRLVLTALASASISASGMTGSSEAALVIWYSTLATVLIWAPVLSYLLLGQWAIALLDRGLEWLTRWQRPVSVSALIVIALWLVSVGIALL